MIRIGVITICNENYPNFGNRLQNYAVQQLLLDMGCYVETLYFEGKAEIPKSKLLIQKGFGYKLPGDHKYWCNIARVSAFCKFDKKRINIRRVYDFNDIAKEYDYFIVGSDQVWNPTWYSEKDKKMEAYFLKFAENQQKISLSPSFGMMELPELWKDIFADNLKTFMALSVREKSGADIIKNLTGREAKILIDPTMMLKAEQWMQIASKPKWMNSNTDYILTYFIGGISSQAEQFIKKTSEKNDLHVLRLLDLSYPNQYPVDPGEFIYLLSHAKLILTDSFHACVFSFLLGKPFLVFERNDMGTSMMCRIETFTNTFDIRRKVFSSELKNELFEANYSTGYRSLDEERGKVFDYLKQAIHTRNIHPL